MLDVELDVGPGQTRVVISKTTEVSLAPVEAWINGRLDADNRVQHGMTFLNHLICQQLCVQSDYIRLSRGLHFERGAHEARRIPGALQIQSGLRISVRGGCNRLFVCLNTFASTFWIPGNLLRVMLDFLSSEIGESEHLLPFPPLDSDNKLLNFDLGHDIESLVATVVTRWTVLQQRLRRFRYIKIYTTYTGDNQRRDFTLTGFTTTNANQTIFQRRVQEDGTVAETFVSVADYFRDVHGIQLRFPNLNLVCISRRREVYLPIELCHVADLSVSEIM